MNMSKIIMDDFDAGKKFTEDRVLEIMDKVIHEYKMKEIKMDLSSHKISQAQLNAVEFMKNCILIDLKKS